MAATRLNKLFSQAGLASRRLADDLIRQGRVEVNGRVVTELGEKADPDVDDVRVDGLPLPAPPRQYWLLHKPRGVLTTTRDPRQAGRRNVLDLLPPAARSVRLFPVGRLDLDTEGLLLLTNDGALAHALLHPSRDKHSRYRLYDEQQMRRLQVVVLLRDAGYDFDAIRTTLDELAAGRPQQAIAAVERRRAELARASWASLTAMSAFQEYVSEFWPELSGAL